MKKIVLSSIAFIGLLLTVIPAFLVFYDIINLEGHKNLMLVGAILWFFTAPFIIKKKPIEE